jgi:hypothetical protein
MLMITLSFSISSAVVPGNIHLQGYLDDAGSPINKPVKITLSLYDSEIAEKPLWSQRQTVQVDKGTYEIVLKSLPKYLFEDNEYYVGVEVETESGSICLGRKQLTTLVGR